jgi:hypothetical protein
MALRDRVQRLRTPLVAARIAATLWIVLAVIVWNVVFDHVIVMAAREYLSAADAAAGHASYALIDDWMRPALVRGVRDACAAAAAVLAVAVVAVGFASRNAAPSPADRSCV